MSDNARREPEYVTVCEKCGSEYPLGTSYCTNPLCRANLAVYGKTMQKNAPLDTDVACKKIEEMMKEVMSALSGKTFESEKRTTYQNRFIQTMETARTAKSNGEIDNCLKQAEQWKETCLNEISLLGENLESVRAQAKERVTRARDAVLSALSGKKQEQEKRKEYGAQYDAIWTTVNNSSDSNEIKNCAMNAEVLANQFLAEISRLGEEDVDSPDDGGTTGGTTINSGTTGGSTINGGTTGGTTINGRTTGGTTDNGGTGGTANPRYAAQLQREKQKAQKSIDASMGKVLKALSKKKQGDQYRDKYAVGFKNISAQMQQCRTLEEVKACVGQAEALRDSDLIEIKGMKNKLGVVKSVLLVLLVLFVLGFIQGIVTSVIDLAQSSSQGSENASDENEDTDGTWKSNVLMSDYYDWEDDEEMYEWPVLGSDSWIRSDITSIYILDTLDDEAEDSWDVSEAQDGSVKAWVVKNGSDVILYIAGEGGICAPEICNDLFAGYAADTIELGTAFHTDGVVRMNAMFYNCMALETLDLTGMNTSAVTGMYAMFYNCNSLKELDVSNFNTSLVEDMSYMFDKCSSLTKLDVTNFDTSNVTKMYALFSDCSALEEVYLYGLDTSNVTDMRYMFKECSSLTKIDFTGIDTSSVTNMSNMFTNCSSLTELDVSGFDTSSVTDMSYMFYGCSNLAALDVTEFDTSKVTTTRSMFYECSGLTELNLAGFDFSNVTDLSYMFYNCSNLRTIGISIYDFGLTSEANSDYMLEGCTSIDTSSLLTE